MHEKGHYYAWDTLVCHELKAKALLKNDIIGHYVGALETNWPQLVGCGPLYFLQLIHYS